MENLSITRTQEYLFKTKLILLNGPPASGKQEVFVKRYFPDIQHFQMADELKRSVCDDVGLPQTLDYIRHLDTFKNEPLPSFNGRSFRELIISKAENHMKPMLGKHYYAKFVIDKYIKENYLKQIGSFFKLSNKIIISDLGFEEELEYFSFVIPPHQIFIIRIYPTYLENIDFSKDSRKYMDGTKFGIWNFNAFNNVKDEFSDLDNQMKLIFQVIGD